MKKIKYFLMDLKKHINEKYVNIITRLFYKIQTNRYSKKLVPSELYGTCSFGDDANFKSAVHFNPIPIVLQTIDETYNCFDSLNIHGINIDVEQQPIVITIYTTKPGLIIGKHGKDYDIFKNKLINIFNEPDLKIDLQEVKDKRTHLYTFY